MAQDMGTRIEQLARALFRAGPGSATSEEYFEKLWGDTNQHYWRHEAYKFIVAFDTVMSSLGKL